MSTKAAAMNRNVWTDEENERLKELVGRGVSMARAAVIFGRNISAVKKQARKIGTPFRIPPQKRTEIISPSAD
jgi:hypothetical protein